MDVLTGGRTSLYIKHSRTQNKIKKRRADQNKSKQSRIEQSRFYVLYQGSLPILVLYLRMIADISEFV